MAETREKSPAAEQRRAQAEQRDAEAKQLAAVQDRQAELNIQAKNIEAARRTGLPLKQAASVLERLETEGDFYDEKGRWTLDVAGFPVCHYGWKEETIELP